jgi:hypothetical protein
MKLYLLLSTAVASALFLSACNPQPVIKQLTLTPSSVTWGTQSHFSASWECNIPLPGQGFFSNGLGPETVNAGEAPSGFDDIYNQGAQPLPCTQQEQILYRGHVQFDLSQFDTVTSSDLHFGVSRSTQNAQPQTPPQCVATVLGMSTGTRDDGDGPYFWDYDNEGSLTPMNPCETLIPPQYSVGVSTQVRDWIDKQHSNFGFIIAGPNLGPPGLPSDNNGNVTFYNNFQLVVYYNPAQNPRAPQ